MKIFLSLPSHRISHHDVIQRLWSLDCSTAWRYGPIHGVSVELVFQLEQLVTTTARRPTPANRTNGFKFTSDAFTLRLQRAILISYARRATLAQRHGAWHSFPRHTCASGRFEFLGDFQKPLISLIEMRGLSIGIAGARGISDSETIKRKVKT